MDILSHHPLQPEQEVVVEDRFVTRILGNLGSSVVLHDTAGHGAVPCGGIQESGVHSMLNRPLKKQGQNDQRDHRNQEERRHQFPMKGALNGAGKIPESRKKLERPIRFEEQQEKSGGQGESNRSSRKGQCGALRKEEEVQLVSMKERVGVVPGASLHHLYR